MEATDPSTLLGHPFLEGWMLKKKRKKMQGFARRYFYLSQEPALLSYSFSPNSRIRDSVLISLSSISISRKSRSIHIDSGGSLVMHIKTLNDNDFLRWTAALQSLASSALMERRRRRRRRIQQGRHTANEIPKSSELSISSISQAGPSVRPVEMSNLYHSVARMQAPLAALEAIQPQLQQLLKSHPIDSNSLSPPSSSLRPPANCLQNPSLTSHQLSSPNPSSSSSSTSSSSSNNRFSSVPSNTGNSDSSKHRKPRLIKTHLTTSAHNSSLPFDTQKVLRILSQSIEQLKVEQLNLVDLINLHRSSIVSQPKFSDRRNPDPNPTTTTSTPNTVNVSTKRLSRASLRNSSLSSSSPSSAYLTPTDSTTPKSRTRSSTITKANLPNATISESEPLAQPSKVVEGDHLNRSPSSSEEDEDEDEDEYCDGDSGSDNIFHDAAEDEDLMFVDLDVANAAVDTETELLSGADNGLDEESEEDSDSEFSSGGTEFDESNRLNNSSSSDNNLGGGCKGFETTIVRKEDNERRDSHENLEGRKDQMMTIRRRTELPATVSGEEFSVFSFFKKNVGKDLSQVSFPISFNEPLSALQKLCEEFEYVDQVLRKAVRSKEPVSRLVYVTAYVISGYSGTKNRVVRKPFNPMLGETYECIRPDKGFRFISEKVLHHPPSIAGYAEGEGFKVEVNLTARQKFWGQSVEIIQEGLNRLTIYKHDDEDEEEDERSDSKKSVGEDRGSKDVYVWDKPSSFVRNLMSGTKYLEHIGKVSIVNLNGTERSIIDFKAGTTFGGESSRNKVEAKVYDRDGKLSVTITGRWDSHLIKTSHNIKQKHKQQQQKDDEEEEGLIFKVNDLPKRSNEFYGFTKFAIELNEITDDLVGYLPDNDSRLRPDQRLFEQGKVEEAESIKRVLEENQRNRKKESKEMVSQWFEKDENGKDWIYKGGYFETREKGSKGFKELNLFKH
ncbi:Oxysterol-binding protein-domain-containing protein [Phakopsora pachyrhizi]|uniref:Oxysterol-binding protein-domain-containing protein n=1 Tax=Phakopsora pachyrhizi TaxID=170000 RepID=A0AAV0BUV7_PHAPC|nr:Oxysterol-binding protein-domain-containing protein [Phakopsora pachyrhizi]